MIPHDLAACCEYDLASHRALVDAIRNIASRNKKVFGVNPGHMWDEIDRMTGWIDQLMSLWEQGAIKPQDRSDVSLRRSRRGPSFHSGPQEHREGSADAVVGPTWIHRADCSILKQAGAGRSKDAEGFKRFTRGHTSPNGGRDLVLYGRLG
jgi:hypothetical protein